MKKVSIEMNFNVVKELAKLFEIKFVGVNKENLVSQVNEAIEKLNNQAAPKKGKWYELETPTFKEGDIVNVKTGWAAGRQVKIVKPSAKRNAYKGNLYNPKTGELQDTLVGIDEIDIELYVPNFPVVIDQAI